MLRIVEEVAANDSMTLRLDGRLISEWVGLLRSNCERAFGQGACLILDLAGVSFADHEGVQLLQQLEQRQVTIINCSPFLREQLKQPANSLSVSMPSDEQTAI